MREDEHLFFWVRFRYERFQFDELLIGGRLPIAVRVQQRLQCLHVALQVLRKRGFEQAGTNPAESLFERASIFLVNSRCARHAVCDHIDLGRFFRNAIEQVLWFSLDTVDIFIKTVAVQQISVQRTYRQIKAILDGIEINLVA